jgi:hypothetical protein
VAKWRAERAEEAKAAKAEEKRKAGVKLKVGKAKAGAD